MLSGKCNPSTKPPITYPESEIVACYANNPSRYPSFDEGSGYPVMCYSAELEKAYRWH